MLKCTLKMCPSDWMAFLPVGGHFGVSLPGGTAELAEDRALLGQVHGGSFTITCSRFSFSPSRRIHFKNSDSKVFLLLHLEGSHGFIIQLFCLQNAGLERLIQRLGQHMFLL